MPNPAELAVFPLSRNTGDPKNMRSFAVSNEGNATFVRVDVTGDDARIWHVSGHYPSAANGQPQRGDYEATCRSDLDVLVTNENTARDVARIFGGRVLDVVAGLDTTEMRQDLRDLAGVGITATGGAAL